MYKADKFTGDRTGLVVGSLLSSVLVLLVWVISVCVQSREVISEITLYMHIYRKITRLAHSHLPMMLMFYYGVTHVAIPCLAAYISLVF